MAYTRRYRSKRRYYGRRTSFTRMSMRKRLTLALKKIKRLKAVVSKMPNKRPIRRASAIRRKRFSRTRYYRRY